MGGRRREKIATLYHTLSFGKLERVGRTFRVISHREEGKH